MYRTVKERLNMRYTYRNASQRTNFKCTNRNDPRYYRQITNWKPSLEVCLNRAPIVALQWLKAHQSEIRTATYFKTSLSVYTALISELLTCNIVYDIN